MRIVATTSQMIRTLQIGNFWFEEQHGGLGRVYHELSQHLPRLNVQCQGLVIGNRQPAQDESSRLKVFASAKEPVHQRLLKARSSIRAALLDDAIDLIASHFALYTFPALGAIKKRPMVVHFHGPWAAETRLEGSPWLNSLVQATIEKVVYQRATKLIVLSNAFAKELTQRYKVREEAIRVVPAGVDTVRFGRDVSKSEARQRLGWPGDRYIIVAVRRLAHRMGLEDLLEATEILARAGKDVLVHIVGIGRLLEELQSQIDCAGLSNQVKLLGRIDDRELPLVYRAADLSIVPTVALEGFGMTTLESLASGTPVMVTPVGGLPEVVRHLSSALIFESAGPAAIADGVEEVLKGRRKLPSEEECSAYANRHFTWPVVAESVSKIYREALESY